jgi:hypothetical protein
MKRFDPRILLGLFLILAGALFLLQTFDIIPSAWGVLWGAMFALAGVVFLYVYFSDRSQWWPLIPGVSLLGLGALILADLIWPGSPWTGAIFLGSIGVAFWLIYALHREHWWAIIPGGVLLTLAVVAGLEGVVGEGESIFFLGMGLTFLLLAILPKPQGPMPWAYIPAAALIVLGIFLFSPFQSIFNYVWPVVIILTGVFVLWRNLRAR